MHKHTAAKTIVTPLVKFSFLHAKYGKNTDYHIENVLSCFTVWYGNCSASDRKALQREVKTAQRITGA